MKKTKYSKHSCLLIYNNRPHLFLLIIFLLLLTISFSCKKKNIIPEATVDNIDGRKIRYTVLVLNADNSIGKNTKTLDSATVTLAMNDSVYTVAVDENNFVVFDYLFAGNAIVKVECEGYTTANLIVNLKAMLDTANIYDSGNLRKVSTIVTLFSTKGEGTATISGKAFADLDLTNSSYEFVPENINIRAIVCPEQIYEYVNHSASGGIIDLFYENIIFATETDNFGNFQVTVPASAKGLKIFLQADDFVYQQQIAPDETVRQIFSYISDTVTVFPNSLKITDLYFYTN